MKFCSIQTDQLVWLYRDCLIQPGKSKIFPIDTHMYHFNLQYTLWFGLHTPVLKDTVWPRLWFQPHNWFLDTSLFDICKSIVFMLFSTMLPYIARNRVFWFRDLTLSLACRSGLWERSYLSIIRRMRWKIKQFIWVN